MVDGTWSIVCENPALAKKIAADLNLKVNVKNYDWRLTESHGRWTLEDKDGRTLKIDFDETGPNYHRKSPKGRAEILARALGSNKKVTRIADLSAGLGQDSVFLSQLGFHVTAVERHPVLAFLLGEARKLSPRKDLEKLEFIGMDAKDYLKSPHLIESLQAAYFDPMYPSKKKSALPRKEMVLFRGLVGVDDDSEEVAKLASEKIPRLVIKRPLEAPPLLPKPVSSMEGKTVRYDIYVRS